MIEIKNLSKTYHNKNTDVKALDNVTLNFGNTGMAFIYGESGNGKSTLLNIMSGLDTFDEGDLIVDGVSMKTFTKKDMDAYRCNHIGFIFEDYNLINSLNVSENIKIAKRFNGIEPTDEEVSDVLKQLNLVGYEKRMPNELSGGQKQRISIARTLIEQPKVLFVDEPTGHLDHSHTHKIWEYLKKLSKTCLVIAVSHEKAIVDEFADRIIELRDGKVFKDINNEKKAAKITATKSKIKQVKVNEDEKVEKLDLVKKGKIGFKNVAKFGWSNLGVKKLRTTAVIILSCISLVFFSMFFLMNNYNNYNVLAQSIVNDKLDYITFEKAEEQITNKEYSSVLDIDLGANESLLKLYDVDMKIGFGASFVSSINRNFSIKGLVEINETQGATKNALGQKILYGAYPTIEGNKGIAISDYVAALISKYGAKEYISGVETSIIKPSMDRLGDLIGKRIEIDNTNYEINAIYETDYTKYVTTDMVVKEGQEETFNYYLDNVYSIIHVAPKFISNSLRSVSDVQTNVYAKRLENNQVYTNEVKVTSSESLPNFTAEISYDIYNALYEENITADDVTNNNFSLTGDNYITLRFNNGQTVRYSVSNVIANGGQVNISSENFYSDNLTQKNENNELVVISSVARECLYSSNRIIVKSSVNLEKAIEELDKMGFTFTSEHSAEINAFSDKINIFKTAFLTTSIITALFSAILMYVFMAQMIADRKHEIGILIALGGSKWDVAKIFLFSIASMALACFLASTVVTVILSVILNSVISGSMGLPFNLLNMNFAIFGYMFLICVGVTILAASLPILGLTKKKPAEIMKRF